MSDDEVWKPTNYAGYEVSNLGGVRSVDRVVEASNGKRLHYKGRVLSQKISPQGYRCVNFGCGPTVKTCFTHRLVAAAFIGPRPEGLFVCHNDGNSLNNRVDNLRYDTHSANMKDAVKHGTHSEAKKTHCKYGHEYSEENTYVGKQTHGGPSRICRTCARNRRMAQAEERTSNTA